MARMPLALAAALVAVLAAATSPAAAHPVLTHSEPGDGTSVADAPRQVRLEFNEAISERFRVVHLLDGRGRTVPGTGLRTGGDARRLVLDVPRLRRGTYEVTWEVLAQGDGHITGGAAVFGLGRPAGAAPRPAPGAGPSTVEAVLRWLDFSLYALVIGAIAVAMSLQAQPAGRALGKPSLATEGRVLAGAACSSALALGLGVILLVRQADGLTSALPAGAGLHDAVARMLPARWGILWGARELLLAALVATLAWLVVRGRDSRAHGRPWATLAVAGGLAVGLAVVRALGGHAAALPSPAPHVAADAVHVVAAGLWIGGVLVLGVALWPAGGRSRADSLALARATMRRFGWVAGGAGLALAVTGLYAAGAQIASVDALLTTGYGETLLAKVGLVLATAALGAANVVLLRRSRARPVRLLLVEGAAGLGALIAAAQLTASSPPRGAEFAAPRQVVAPTLVRQVADVLVTATPRPNRPGTNVVTVAAASSRRPPRAPIDAVAVGVRGGRAVALREIAPGRWAGGVDLPAAGRARMTVRLRRGPERLRAALPWTVEPADPARPVVVSARRLAPLTERAALLVASTAVLAALTLAVTGARRRPRPHRRSSPVSTLEERTT
ncbi:MAG TPA: copper resistance protein CopC [Baekduia sp.]|uniref:copper resistance CopC/CopD family protein n=1 Tax=Baekduia sp. TaxID=2600305 RepID=UPI002C9048FA|nr:copper resistance protein CopC [Baekduia sp.]HMJ36240.1 copper resistance protein CopC [Baekduia sp.]